MHSSIPKSSLLLVLCACLSTACLSQKAFNALRSQDNATAVVLEPLESAAPTPSPARLLTVCMGREPASLFLYSDNSIAARTIREAIYDGPYDLLDFNAIPVILEKMPSLADGDLRLEPVAVSPGSLISDRDGKLVNLEEGTTYLPSGCSNPTCSLTFAGQKPVQMDQLVVSFKLRSGLQWSDSAPLTADDSVYSYEVASALFPRARADLISHTFSYRSLDDAQVEWRGVPGYRDAGAAGFFFTPLPRHAWGSLVPKDLLTSELANRKPLGWGPYIIDEWKPGDHISFSRNASYFRGSEGLPHFDRLVFRFVPDQDAALSALQAGECDFLDETALSGLPSSRLKDLKDSGKAALLDMPGAAWEHLDFAIQSMNTAAPAFFQAKATRQAVALCLDRQRMADSLLFDKSQVADSYIPAAHPLFNPQVKRYPYDPKAGAALLDSAGWVDQDGNPATARQARGVNGVADGTPFEITLLTTDETEKQAAAQMIQESLAQCGIKINISTTPWDKLFASGPGSALFGRNFTLAQFGWASTIEPPCLLYTTQEIPGPYPDFPKGWGGANVSGYSNPQYDWACQQALFNLPGTPEHTAAHLQAQMIFTDDLPALPLYWRLRLVAMRPDLCGVKMDASSDNALWKLEEFDYGENCPQ